MFYSIFLSVVQYTIGIYKNEVLPELVQLNRQIKHEDMFNQGNHKHSILYL